MSGRPRSRQSTIATSWADNAANWTQAVRNREIPSRCQGTDAAIVAAVTQALAGLAAPRFLDVGCGEGWLVRAVAAAVPGCHAVGIDGTPELIDAARAVSPDGEDQVSFRVLSYADLVAGPEEPRTSFDAAPFDVVVFNYALLDDDTGVAAVLAAVADLLTAQGAVIIQTVLTDDDAPDGWQEEDFTAFPNGAWTPMPWYRRSPTSWRRVVENSGLRVEEMTKPMDAAGTRPLSLLISCRN